MEQRIRQAVEKLRNEELGAFYSKNRKRKSAFINAIVDHKKAVGQISQVVYFCPRKFKEEVQETVPGSHIFCYEDLQKTNLPFSLASNSTLLILDDCSRYKNITTSIFARLSKLTIKYKYKFIVDIVPFTTDTQYLYTPWCYLSRTILGHQHWYAFRENNLEMTETGELVRGLDYTLLARKIKSHCYQDYEFFFSNESETIFSPLTSKEKEAYQSRKRELFDEYEKKAGKEGQSPIVTRLADFTNMLESRYAKLEALLDHLQGKTILYTNIKSHNAPLAKRFKETSVRTYYDINGDEREADHIILFEVPIVKGYLFLDVLANLSPSCKVWIFTSDAMVDKYLYNKMLEEYSRINSFTTTLWEVLTE